MGCCTSFVKEATVAGNHYIFDSNHPSKSLSLPSFESDGDSDGFRSARVASQRGSPAGGVARLWPLPISVGKSFGIYSLTWPAELKEVCFFSGC